MAIIRKGPFRARGVAGMWLLTTVSDAAHDVTDVSSRCERTRQKERRYSRRFRTKCCRRKPVGAPECLHMSQTPLLHVGLDRNKNAFPETTGTICANGGKEVVTVETKQMRPQVYDGPLRSNSCSASCQRSYFWHTGHFDLAVIDLVQFGKRKI
jgi:hypothetical protein